MTPPQIKLCYRADFSQPKGRLNPGGFDFKGPVTVEIRKRGKTWRAFRPDSNHEFTEITEQGSPEAIRATMCLYFEKQLSAWKTYEIRPDGQGAVQIQPEEIYTDPKGRTYRRDTPK